MRGQGEGIEGQALGRDTGQAGGIAIRSATEVEKCTCNRDTRPGSERLMVAIIR